MENHPRDKPTDFLPLREALEGQRHDAKLIVQRLKAIRAAAKKPSYNFDLDWQLSRLTDSLEDAFGLRSSNLDSLIEPAVSTSLEGRWHPIEEPMSNSSIHNDSTTSGPQNRWQPIETVPKDGRRIVLGRAGQESICGRWFDTDPDHGFGWFTNGGIIRPTHWQPLPPAPASEPK